uniref:Uncharacterized protein n=1 Tax=Arundo donax TaxID=35708 RepID=A0A0A9HK06_ARUDO
MAWGDAAATAARGLTICFRTMLAACACRT